MKTAIYSIAENSNPTDAEEFGGGAYPVYLSDEGRSSGGANTISLRLDGSAHAQWRVLSKYTPTAPVSATSSQTNVIDTRYFDPKPAEYFSCALGVWCT